MAKAAAILATGLLGLGLGFCGRGEVDRRREEHAAAEAAAAGGEAAAAPTSTTVAAAGNLATTTTIALPGQGTFLLGPFHCDAGPTKDGDNSKFLVSVNPNNAYPANEPGHGSILLAVNQDPEHAGADATNIPQTEALAVAQAIGNLSRAIDPTLPVILNPDEFPFDDWYVPNGCYLPNDPKRWF